MCGLCQAAEYEKTRAMTLRLSLGLAHWRSQSDLRHLAPRQSRGSAWALVGALALSACVGPPSTGPSQTAADANATPGAAASDSTGPATIQGAPYTWKNVAILGGGFVTGVIFSPVQAGVVYARTDVGGAYRLNPADGNWIPLLDHFGREDSNLTGVESIAADPVDANVVYAALGTYTQSWAGNGAILRSKDQGNTWQRVDMPIKMGGNEYGRSNGERLVVDPNQPSILFFGSRRSGLWKSADSGATWAKVESFQVPLDPEGIGISLLVFDAKSGTKGKPTPALYAAVARTDTSLYVSRDGGGTWKAVPNQPAKMMPTHAEFDSAGALYLSYANHPGPSDIVDGAVYKYEPKTGAFTNITPLAPKEKDKFGYGGLSVDARRPGTLVVSTIDRWTNGDEIFRSTDGGKRWKPIFPTAVRDVAGAQYLYFGRPKLGPSGWMGDIDIDPFNSDRAMHVSGQGIWATLDLTASDAGKPTTWRFFNHGLEETVVADLISPPSGPPLISGVLDICGFRHDDLDQPSPTGMFENPSCNAASSLDFAESKPEVVVRVGTIWGEGAHGGISHDGGKTWNPFATEPKGGVTGGGIAVSADASTLLWVVKNDTPVYSRDDGKTWVKTRGLPVPPETASWVVVSLRPASDRVNPNKFYAFDSEKGHVYVSTDGAVSFERTMSGLPELPDYARSSGSTQTVPGIEGNVWITTGKDVFRSTDSGKSFMQLGTVEESFGLGFGKAAPGRSHPAVYLIGKVQGVTGFFRSDDTGKTWARINDDRHQFGFANIITGDPRRYGRVYVGTGGRGILYGDPQ